MFQIIFGISFYEIYSLEKIINNKEKVVDLAAFFAFCSKVPIKCIYYRKKSLYNYEMSEDKEPYILLAYLE